MKRQSKSRAKPFLKFSEVVANVPDDVVAFFRNFTDARGRLSLTAEIDVLNAVAAEEYRNCAPSTVLMRWFEVFRAIYILHCRGDRDSRPVKDPNDFSTFARTFEPLAFLPDFWFVDARNVRSRDLRGRVHGLRLAFERYLYERAGGGVWGAMDWEMDRFLQRRIYETLKSDETGALRRLAALALTARAVAAGELGIYVEERDDVTLPLTGISNVWNIPGKRNSLLKYYHYDRYTQLSFAREHEFAKDPNVRGTHVRFEREWMALAVISDVILKESDAHSTQAAATRVMLESVSQCMFRILEKLRRETSHRLVRSAAEWLYEQVTCRPDELALMSEAELLASIGVKERPVPSDHYLGLCGFADAKSFWNGVRPIFDELVGAFDRNRDRVVAKYTEEQRRGGYRDDSSVDEMVRSAIVKGAFSELPGAMGVAAFRDSLRRLMLDGSVTLQYAVIDKVLTGSESPDRRVQVWSEDRRVVRELPSRLPFSAVNADAFRKWTLEYLSDLSAQCAEVTNRDRRAEGRQWIEDREKGGVAGAKTPKRNLFPTVSPLDYRHVDFGAVVAAADRLWNFYFTQDDVCMDRWMVSVDRALEILRQAEEGHVGVWIFNSTFRWPYSLSERYGLWKRLKQEKLAFQQSGRWPEDMAALKRSLMERPSCTIGELLSGESRLLVMLAVLARLLVHTAVVRPALWGHEGDLFAFYTHILVASNRDFDSPFPWHLDIASGSYLRVGRSHARQVNVVDAFVRGEFYDESERTAFIVFVAHYLAGQEEPAEVLRAIAGNCDMAKYFARDDQGLAERRLALLKAYFE